MMNAQKIRKALASVNYIRTVPVYLCVLASKHKPLIEMDIERWKKQDRLSFSNLFEALNWYLTYRKEFRNLLQHRLKYPSKTVVCWLQYGIARILWWPLETLYLTTVDIGGGLYIQHGFATYVAAKSMGENCWVNQQVTIGYEGDQNPILEDGVTVHCGAKIIGGITMHRGSKAGAGAVVVKDVPAGAVVVGVPAHVVRIEQG